VVVINDVSSIDVSNMQLLVFINKIKATIIHMIGNARAEDDEVDDDDVDKGMPVAGASTDLPLPR
jgi:hypothetical protein